ncbi:MAG: dihydroneopterin aldolase [Mesorhizobium sp.]|uniref:dihydroneopterin aldolase n=1 Tax=Mesorhizobium sp. TaxID=1871066 RepID=UPI000FE89F5F|nr:MAG: dihydroneopterin aldolase [Mesorhizobium sp.]
MDRIDTVRLASFSVAAEAGAPRANAPWGVSSEAPSAGVSADKPEGRMDIVFIENFIGQTIIGIDSSELHVPQPVRMNLAIGVPAIRACATDRIEDTINYAAVRAALHALLESHGVRLLEALAEAVARLLINDFGAHWVRVALAKPAKFDDVAAVGVQIERQRSDMPKAAYVQSAQSGLADYASLGEGLIPN